MEERIVSLAEQIISMEHQTEKREQKLVELRSAILLQQQIVVLRLVVWIVHEAATSEDTNSN